MLRGASEPLFSIRALDFCQLAKQPWLSDRAATRARRDPARGRETAENCEVSALYGTSLSCRYSSTFKVLHIAPAQRCLDSIDTLVTQ